MGALRTVFIFSLIISLIAAIASLLRGPQYVHQDEDTTSTSAEKAQRRYIAIALMGIYASRHNLLQNSSGSEARDILEKSMRLLLMSSDPRRFGKGSAPSILKGGSTAR